METGMIIVFLVFGVVFITVAGANIKNSLSVAATSALIGASFLVAAIVMSKETFGTLHDNTLNQKIFVVKAKVSDDGGGKGVFILFDLKAKKNRLAELDKYPPSGYKETMTADRGLLLSPL